MTSASSSNWTKAATLNELAAAYVEAARTHAAASEEGNYRGANRAHDSITLIYRELCERGREGQSEILTLLRSTDASVRLWAALHSLKVAPAESEAVLQAIASGGPSLLRLSAEMTLSEWRNGQLQMP